MTRTNKLAGQELLWWLLILLSWQTACKKTETTGPADRSASVPLKLDGMLAWYDLTDAANVVINKGGRVSALKDKSGKGNTMNRCYNGSSYPIYHSDGGANNLPYMSVTNGTEIYTAATVPLSSPCTIYYVMKNDSFVDKSFILDLSSGNSVFLQQNEQPAGHTITVNAGSTFGRNANAWHTQWQVLSVCTDNSNTKLQVNNEPYIQPEFIYNGGNCGLSAGDQISFGPYYKDGFYSVEELIVYKGILSSTDDSLVRDYLVKKYAPVKNKVYLWFGDSITWGAEATNPDSSSFAAIIARDSSGQIVNFAYPSSVAVEIAGGGISGVDGRNGTNLYQIPLQEKIDLSNTFVFFAYGSNDRDNPLNTTYVDSFEIMIQAYLDYGVPANHIMVCTNPARAAGGPAVLSGIDSAMYGTLKTIAADKAVKFFDCWTWEASTWTPSFMYSDGIHLSDAGMRAYAKGVEAALSQP